MTDRSTDASRQGSSTYVEGAVPPAFDDEEPWPVPDAAPDAGGMVRFAGLILGLTGIWHAIAGLVALTEPSYFSTSSARLPVDVGYTAWGWVYLVLGVLAVGAGFGVIAGNRVAAVIAVVLAVVSAVVNLVFITANPVWSVLIIALDVLVVWGVTAQAPPPRPAR